MTQLAEKASLPCGPPQMNKTQQNIYTRAYVQNDINISRFFGEHGKKGIYKE